MSFRFLVTVVCTAWLLLLSTGTVHAEPAAARFTLPALGGFTPPSGAPGTSVTITASVPLTNTVAVRFGGVSATQFSANGTQVVAVVPPGAITGRIAVDVNLIIGKGISPNLIQTLTTAQSFIVVGATTITSFTPAQGPPGTSVTVTGSGFTGASAVAFGGVSAPGFLTASDTSITVNVPAGAVTGPISVTSIGGTAVSTTPFTVLAPPTITSFTPTTGPVGTAVTITGTLFSGATGVTFGGVSATVFNVVNAQTITATVPAGAASGPIGVTTPAGTATSTQIFTLPGAPVITSFTPIQGPVGATVTVTGSAFTGVSGLTFGGAAATAFTVTSDTSITATVPSGAVTGPIGVSGPKGGALSTTSFTVVVPPRIDTFTPTTGGPGTTVIVSGGGFSGTTGVTVGGVAVNNFTVLTDSSLSLIASQSGVINITTPNGSATSTTPFTITGVPAPTPTTLSGTVVSASPSDASVTTGTAGSVGTLVVQNTGTAAQTLQSLTINLTNGGIVASATATAATSSASATASAVPNAGTLVFQFGQPITLQGGQSATVTITLTATGTLSASNTALGVVFGFALLGLAPRRTRRTLLTLAAISCLGFGLVGCGGGGRGAGGAVVQNSLNSPVTATATTSVTVSAVSAAGPNGETVVYSGVPVRLGLFTVTSRR